MSTIVVSVTARLVYGKERYYPEDENAKLLCVIRDHKTLDLKSLRAAHKLGIQIKLLNAPVDGLGTAVRKLSEKTP